MLVDEPCIVKDAIVIDSTVDMSDPEAIDERQQFNCVLTQLGKKPLREDQPNAIGKEMGVLLLLYSERLDKEYCRFMPQSMIRETLGGLCRDLTNDELEFFATKLKERTHPINITILESEEDGYVFNKQIQTMEPPKQKTKLIGAKNYKKKGKKK